MNTDKAKEYLKNLPITKKHLSLILDVPEVMTDFAQQQAQEKAYEFEIWRYNNEWESYDANKYYRTVYTDTTTMPPKSKMEYKTFTELWQLFEKEIEGK